MAKTSAVTLVSELGQLSRFAAARQLMGYARMVSRKRSSGARINRGPISKTLVLGPNPSAVRSIAQVLDGSFHIRTI